jgi:hypothetical protein
LEFPKQPLLPLPSLLHRRAPVHHRWTSRCVRSEVDPQHPRSPLGMPLWPFSSPTRVPGHLRARHAARPSSQHHHLAVRPRQPRFRTPPGRIAFPAKALSL